MCERDGRRIIDLKLAQEKLEPRSSLKVFGGSKSSGPSGSYGPSLYYSRPNQPLHRFTQQEEFNSS